VHSLHLRAAELVGDELTRGGNLVCRAGFESPALSYALLGPRWAVLQLENEPLYSAQLRTGGVFMNVR
jgi:hypothetical protein